MRTIILSLLCTFCSLPAFSQEKAFEDKVNAFMQQQRANIYAFAKSEDAASVDDLKRHPFVKSFKQFIKENGNTYASLRKERFAQYAPPPAALQQLDWQSGGNWNTNIDLLSVIFMRTFEPSFPSQFVYSLTIPRIAAKTAAPVSEISSYYKAKVSYGNLLYTKLISDSIYQVWAANRIFAITYKMNIYNGNLSDIKFNLPKDPAYAKIKWTPSLLKPVDETTRLEGELSLALWNRTSSLKDFYIQNINRYKQVREEKLQPYVRDYTPAKIGYREIEAVSERITVDTLTRTCIYPVQWESTIQSASIEADNGEKVAQRLQLNGFFAPARYVKKIDKDHWEVWVVNETDRAYYIWNTYSGEIEKPRYWIKE